MQTSWQVQITRSHLFTCFQWTSTQCAWCSDLVFVSWLDWFVLTDWVQIRHHTGMKEQWGRIFWKEKTDFAAGVCKLHQFKLWCGVACAAKPTCLYQLAQTHNADTHIPQKKTHECCRSCESTTAPLGPRRQSDLSVSGVSLVTGCFWRRWMPLNTLCT